MTKKAILDGVAPEDFTVQETLNGNIKTLMVRRRSHRRRGRGIPGRGNSMGKGKDQGQKADFP